MEKKSSLTIKDAMNQIAQKKFPVEALLEITKWSEIRKSPWSDSFYNAVVGWNFKPHGSLRIADHWNFTSRGKKHCETITPIDNVWALGKFDDSVKKYHIIKTFETPDVFCKDTYQFKLLKLEVSYETAIKEARNSGIEVAKRVELSFLNIFYRICENHLVQPENIPIFAL